MHDTDYFQLQKTKFVNLNKSLTCHVKLDGWKCRQHTSFGVLCDDVVVGVERVHTVDMVPVGTFICGKCAKPYSLECCHEMHDDITPVCLLCANIIEVSDISSCTTPSKLRVLVSSLCDAREWCVKEGVKMLHIETSVASTYDVMNKCANTVAKSMRRHYFDGRLLPMDLWHRTLARRGIKKWKSYVRQRMRKKLTYVYHYCVGLDANTSHMLACEHGV